MQRHLSSRHPSRHLSANRARAMTHPQPRLKCLAWVLGGTPQHKLSLALQPMGPPCPRGLSPSLSPNPHVDHMYIPSSPPISQHSLCTLYFNNLSTSSPHQQPTSLLFNNNLLFPTTLPTTQQSPRPCHPWRPLHSPAPPQGVPQAPRLGVPQAVHSQANCPKGVALSLLPRASWPTWPQVPWGWRDICTREPNRQ
jgi:hypothetical protein